MLRLVATVIGTLAFCAVLLVYLAPGPAVVQEVEPNTYFDQAQSLTGPYPLVVEGVLSADDASGYSVPRQDARGEWRLADGLEDLYSIEMAGRGPVLELSGFEGNLDLYLVPTERLSDKRQSISPEGSEHLDLSGFPGGTFVVAVSAYDHAEQREPTPYRLLIR